MKITFLGTSGSLPTKNRNQVSIHLKYRDKSILWDCGEGTQRQLTKTNISPFKIDQIYITHLHPDHFMGLWGLIRSLEFMGREQKLVIHGPKGLESYLDMFKGGSYVELSYPIDFKEIKEGNIHEEGMFKIRAFPVKHSESSYGLVFKEKPEINLDKEKLKEHGLLNNPKCSELKEKGVIEHEEKEIRLEDIAKPLEDGKKVVYSGDTIACKSLEKAAENSDLLIVDSSFGKDKKEKAREYKHGEAGEMAEIAKRADADKLILTHFSNRYEDVEPLENEAKEIFKNTVASKDLMSVEV